MIIGCTLCCVWLMLHLFSLINGNQRIDTAIATFMTSWKIHEEIHHLSREEQRFPLLIRERNQRGTGKYIIVPAAIYFQIFNLPEEPHPTSKTGSTTARCDYLTWWGANCVQLVPPKKGWDGSSILEGERGRGTSKGPASIARKQRPGLFPLAALLTLPAGVSSLPFGYRDAFVSKRYSASTVHPTSSP